MTDDSKEIERIWGQQNVPLVEVPEQLGPKPSDEEFRAGWSKLCRIAKPIADAITRSERPTAEDFATTINFHPGDPGYYFPTYSSN